MSWGTTKLRALAALLALSLCGLFVLSCKREERNFRVEPPSAESLNNLRMTVLEPGPAIHTNEPVKNAYEGNAFAMSEGKRLFSQFNCAGCHAHGGGGMGPPLMDEKWIYGSNPEQVFATIVQGRPNGMPSFGGKIPDYQVWQLAAYVRSMTGLASTGAAPGRGDHISGKKPENSVDSAKPADSAIPRSAEMPK
jgi:cytochrome c oxidase cbb3-type subunit 3